MLDKNFTKLDRYLDKKIEWKLWSKIKILRQQECLTTQNI